MLEATPIQLARLLGGLKGAAEETRLRILALLTHGDLTVKDLTTILGQSQPRISRHLKLMTEAGLINRYPEGAWVYYRLVETGGVVRLVRTLNELIDLSDATIMRDRERLARVKAEHAEHAASYFAANAQNWDQIRRLHVPEERVEAEMLRLVGDRPFRSMLDLGTGTGRALELFGSLYDTGIGIDASHSMLAVARAKLDAAGLAHAQVRQGDIFNLPLPPGGSDLVVLHQVLHYLDDPALAVREAARMLAPGGRMLIVDFAPHHLEFLRTEHAHRRLGLDRRLVADWLETAGLEVGRIEDLRAGEEAGETLTVTLWLAMDTRLPVAEGDTDGENDR